MVLNDDQQRVKSLLQDTIALLCKNGLAFNKQFAIDAVIGVTLDNQSLFYMSFNDVIKSDKRSSPEPEESGEEDAVDMSVSSRKRSRTRHDAPVTSGADGDWKPAEMSHSSVKERLNPKIELVDSDDNEPIFVKQEVSTDWELSATDLTDNSFVSGDAAVDVSGAYPSGSGGFATQDGSSSWQGAYTTSSVPGSSMAESNPPLRGDSDMTLRFGKSPDQHSLHSFYKNSSYPSSFFEKLSSSKPYTYKCTLCTKSFSCPDNLRGHMTVHTGVKQFRCTLCSKEYQYNCTLQRHIKICSRGESNSAPDISSQNGSEMNETRSLAIIDKDCELQVEQIALKEGVGIGQAAEMSYNCAT